MKKRLIAAVVAALALTASVVCAAPQTDYSQGKTTLDLTIRNSDNSIGGNSYNTKYNFDWGLTTGLGNNWGLQYKNYNAQSASTYGVTHELNAQEFNLLYKLDKNLSAYGGSMNIKNSFSGLINESASKNIFQMGLVGSTKLSDKTTGYASVGFGSDLNTWQVGLSQNIAPNMDFNVDYRQINVDRVGMGNMNAKTEGVGFGVSYKF